MRVQVEGLQGFPGKVICLTCGVYKTDENGIITIPDDCGYAVVAKGFTILDTVKKPEPKPEPTKVETPKVETVAISDSDLESLTLEELVELAEAGNYDKRQYAKIKDDKSKMIEFIKNKMN